MMEDQKSNGSVFVGMLPDTMETTPAKTLTQLWNFYHSEDASRNPMAQMRCGSKLMNLARASLFQRDKEFLMERHYAELFEEIRDLVQTIGDFDREEQQNQAQEVCSKMDDLIDNYLAYHLQRVDIYPYELAEERIDVYGKGGKEPIGYRIPVKVSKEEKEEMRKMRLAEAKGAGRNED